MNLPLRSNDLSEVPKPGRAAVEELSHDSKVRALCVFGSVARGAWDEQSDLDLLAVVTSRSAAKSLRTSLRSKQQGINAQVRFMTPDSLERKFQDRTVFAAHLAREGKVLIDRDGDVTGWIETYPADSPVKETAKNLASQLEVYKELDWCAGHYLFCLADLYAWSRSGAMLVLARQGTFEFDRQRVFKRLAEAHPELRPATEIVERLRPFWLLVRRRERHPLPFPPDGSHEETARARDACMEILRTGL